MTAPYSECWDFSRSGACPRGDKCKWEHVKKQETTSTATDEYPVEAPDPSQFCWNYMRNGKCPRGATCNWIHDLILVPGSYMGSSPLYPPPTQSYGLIPAPPQIVTSGDDSMIWSPEFPTTPESHWDQFSENHRLFGTTSSFDPSLSAYTLPVPTEGLTDEQIKKAEELAHISLPSESLSREHFDHCAFCDEAFTSVNELREHLKPALSGTECSNPGSCSEACTKAIMSYMKRKSWILIQESLPHGLVSQIEGIYTRPVTSSTNLHMIREYLIETGDVEEDIREYLLVEIDSLVIMGVMQSGVHAPSMKSQRKLSKSNFKQVSSQDARYCPTREEA
jgi:hypothetical protein